MNISDTTYAGYECVQLSNGALSLWVIKSAGPRIIGLSFPERPNILAEVPDVVLPTPSGRPYRMRGGHRLWHAPEDAERTYVPDDDPPAMAEINGKLCVTQPFEARTGIEKQMCITLVDDEARVIIDHKLTNRGMWPVTLAPWAITQLRPGGLAILPQPTTDTGLLPNRHLALWPYTHIDSPHIRWGDRFVFVDANLGDAKLKIGWPNEPGWLGYALGGTLFVKQAAYYAHSDYFDFGSSSECYCDRYFLELETLGPRTELQPGQAVSHRETWSLHDGVHLDADQDAAAALAARLGL